MSYILERPDLFNFPILLSDIEKQNPDLIFKEIFEDNKLSEFRDFLKNSFEACITSDRFPFSEPEYRSDCLLYKEAIEKCLEAGFIIFSRTELQK